MENKLIRNAMYAPCFAENEQICRDLKWETTTDFIVRKAKKMFKIVEHLSNEYLRRLVDFNHNNMDAVKV